MAKMKCQHNLIKIANILDELAVPCMVACSFQSRVLLDDGFAPVMEIPLLVFNGGNSYFQEVRGYRLVRIVDEQDVESVTLDAASEGQITAVGWITFASPEISSDVVFTALGRVVNTRNQAILKVRNEGG